MQTLAKSHSSQAVVGAVSRNSHEQTGHQQHYTAIASLVHPGQKQGKPARLLSAKRTAPQPAITSSATTYESPKVNQARFSHLEKEKGDLGMLKRVQKAR